MSSIRGQVIGGLAGILGGIAGVIVSGSAPSINPNYLNSHYQHSVLQAQPPASGQQNEQRETYKVKFQIEDDDEMKLQNHMSSKYTNPGEVKGKVRVEPLSAIVEGTAEDIRANLQRQLQLQGMPTVSGPNKALENLAAELEKDPNYLNSNFKLQGYARSEEDGIIHKLSYVPKTGDAEDGPHFEFRAYKREDGTLEIIQVTEYGITTFDPKTASATRPYYNVVAGGLDFEIMYGSTRPGEPRRKPLRIVPEQEGDKITLGRVDVFDHRRRLESGLRKQNLRFTPDWKPITAQQP